MKKSWEANHFFMPVRVFCWIWSYDVAYHFTGSQFHTAADDFFNAQVVFIALVHCINIKEFFYHAAAATAAIYQNQRSNSRYHHQDSHTSFFKCFYMDERKHDFPEVSV